MGDDKQFKDFKSKLAIIKKQRAIKLKKQLKKDN